jgi:hypothetical protein
LTDVSYCIHEASWGLLGLERALCVGFRYASYFIIESSPQFINEYLGKNAMAVNHGLKSCTQEIECTTITLPADHETWPNRRLVLVDTPGFNDTQRGEWEILRKISVWLASALVSSPFTVRIQLFYSFLMQIR